MGSTFAVTVNNRGEIVGCGFFKDGTIPHNFVLIPVFQSDRDGNNEIYSMDADGSYVTRLTNNPANDYFPNWGRGDEDD